ncbi:MAG: DUF4296 domain-containing protein [Bacteroidales bacterium]|nr:DUF4296 domain-containing protein [Bacteroidales bacterium]
MFRKNPTPKTGYFPLLWLTLLIACSDRIPKEEMTEILTEIALSKSYFSSEGIPDARWKDTIPYHHHIVDRHGYQWAQFDSTISWYCAHPDQYQDILDEVIARLSEMEQAVAEELDPPSELWTGRSAVQLPADGARDTVPVNILLKGVGKYVIKAKIRIYPEDSSVDPHVALYWWRSDTTMTGVCDTFRIIPIRKDGLMLEYSMEKTLLPGNEFTHLKGNWLQHGKNAMDTAWRKRAEVKDISVYHIPQKFK